MKQASQSEGDFLVIMMDKPKISNMEKAHKEKLQIMVKAHSEKESLAATDLHRPSLQPPKPKFLISLSLPNSANSSPSTLMKKKKLKHRSIESPCQVSALKRHHQCDQDQLQEMQLRRSKSCGEGRASSCSPSDEFDLILWAKPNAADCDNMMHHSISSFSKTEAIIRESTLVSGKDVETCEEDDQGFKCSALCMYLPGFGKAKAVKTRKEGSEMESGVIISRTVSLEKFECGSWASSSALFHEIEGGDPMNYSSYFDLPLEMIKCSANDDVHSPVTSAFVFVNKDLKGVAPYKTGSSTKSPHHVRFSTSSSSTSKPASPASCNITPRLRKAREDFTAFLEAQSA